MAKLFYTLEETSAKLGKDEDAIQTLVSQGKLREFRDHENRLMFKREEVDLMSADSAGSMELDLSEAPAAGSDSFELDLSDSSDDARSGTGRSESPVGLDADEDRPDALTLELDLGETDSEAGGKSTAASASGLDLDLGNPASKDDDAFALDLGDDDAPASSKPAAKAAADDEPFALDLGDSGAGSKPGAKAASASMSALAAQMPQDEMTLELDLGENEAPAAAPRPAAGGLNDSLGSMAAASAASGTGAGEDGDLGLEGSNVGASPDGSSIADRIGIDGVSSGSGLMDLTSDSESSTIGAALMDEAFSSDEGAELPANASGIFGGESSEGGESGAGLAAAGVGVAAGVAVAAGKKGSAPIFTSGPATPEAYSGPWSGLGVGMLLPASLGLIAAAAMVISKQLGAPPELAIAYAKDWEMYTGILGGVVAVSGAIGFFVGKATE